MLYIISDTGHKWGKVINKVTLLEWEDMVRVTKKV